MSEGKKDDDGKLDWQLLRAGVPYALEDVIRVLEFGAAKYGRQNWRLVENGELRYRNALDRHLSCIDKGETHDTETGLPHLAHVATNALFLLEKQLRQAPPDARGSA